MATFADVLAGLTGQQDQQAFAPDMTQGQTPGDMPLTGNTSTLSNRIQEWLGAKAPDQGGTVQDILAGRFQQAQPTYDDIGNSAIQTLQTGSYVPAQQYTDHRVKTAMDQLESLAKVQYLAGGGGKGSGGNSVFAQTMAAINADPQYAGMSTMDKIRLAQNKVGTNLTIGADGTVSDMTGAAQGLGNLAFGEKQGGTLGQKKVELQYNPLIAGGEATAKNQAELKYADPIAEAAKTGSLRSEQRGALNKRAIQSGDNIAIIDEILTPDDSGRTVLDRANGSGIGALGAKGKQFIGISDEATKANADLAVYGGKLLNNVPRMEGPQSDADVKMYNEQAGKIANPNIPAGDKTAALYTIKALSQKYAAQNTSGIDPIQASRNAIAARNAQGIVNPNGTMPTAPQGGVVDYREYFK